MKTAGDRETYLQTMARLLNRDPPFEPLFTFRFERPTVFASFNRVVNNEAYVAVPESRVTAPESSVVGITGRYLLSYDLPNYGVDLGAGTVFSRQAGKTFGRKPFLVETADDFRLDFTVRRKLARGGRWGAQPFGRTIFDSEFTPTENLATGEPNPRQLLLRGVGGVILSPSEGWNDVQLGAAVQQDLAQRNTELGVDLQTRYERRFGTGGRAVYRLTNDFLYFLPSSRDDESDLALRYNLVNEILVPLVDELSLSVGLDLFFFKGKVPATSTVGASGILRIGSTYERLWKPRYQPFF
jgi:hypothetical protein